MGRTLLVGAILVIAAVVFFLVPCVQTTTTNLDGPNYTGWVSPSFALFQCGVVVGQVGIQVANGSVVNPSAQSAPWNCGNPRL